MSTETTREYLIQQIEDAFNDAEYPGDERIVSNIEYFDNLKVVIDFKGKHWKEILSEVILQHRFDLPRFTSEAFRFYLPAYLIASLRGEDRGEIIQHVVWNLDPQEDQGNLKDEFLAKVEAFSSKQKTAIKAFIKYYAETETHQIPEDKRIKRFWENYPV